MTNKELIRAGLIGSAVLFVVGAAAVYKLTEYEPARGGPVSQPLDGSSSTEPAQLRLTPLPDVEKATPEGGMPSVRIRTDVPMAAYSARGAKGPAAQIAASQRREALRAARAELSEGFAALRQRVERCGARDASFVLALEAQDGAVRVESARLEERGSAPDGAVACAQSELTGQIIPAPTVVAGRRWEVSL